MIKKIFLATLLVLPFCFCKKETPNNGNNPQSTINTVQEIIDDMSLPHEGSPSGVPDYFDWAKKPRIGMGNNPGSFKAFIIWGQVYTAQPGNPAVNTRVQIRNLKAWYLSKRTQRWILLQSGIKAEGAAYREDFAGDVNKPADVRNEPDGSISIRTEKGYNFHFWLPQRVEIDATDIGAIFTTAQAKLILHDPTTTNDRASARYMMSIGADYWSTLSAPWDNFKTNGDVGIGRFKFVRNDWKAFNMTSATPEQLRQNPPPLE